MDPRLLFFDERHADHCVHCGSRPDTRDHIPSKVLLDDPLPPDLAVVGACAKCNNDLSSDEAYLACLVDCARLGTTDHENLRVKVARHLASAPDLKNRLDTARSIVGGQPHWAVERERVARVVLKLARGHYQYLHADARLEPPSVLDFAPVATMSDEQRRLFERPPSADGPAVWPEIGSRAFFAASFGEPFEDWEVVQPGRYRYLVSTAGGVIFRCVLSEYLACWVNWDD